MSSPRLSTHGGVSILSEEGKDNIHVKPVSNYWSTPFVSSIYPKCTYLYMYYVHGVCREEFIVLPDLLY